MRIKRELSECITACNVICTILVIVIHYCSHRGYDIDWNYYAQDVLANGLCRVAVPLFALFSGLFLKAKLDGGVSYKSILINRFWTLLVPYVLASTFVYVSTICIRITARPDLVGEFRVLTVLHDILLHPISVQFWYLRDLMFIVLISPIIFASRGHFNLLVFAASGVSWFVDYQPFPIVGGWHLIHIETLFFASAGGALSRHLSIVEDWLSVKPVRWLPLALVWLLLVCLRVYMFPNFDIWYSDEYSLESLFLYKISIIVGIFVVLRFSKLGGAFHFKFFWFYFFCLPFSLVPFVLS